MATVRRPAEQRVLLRNMSWETYERLIAEREERRVPRFFYDRGVLEIVSPLPEHERIGYIAALLIEVLAEEMDVDLDGLGSTTFRHEDLQRGFEPDQCFYLRNASRVRGKNDIDLTVDPPPDLVIEVDITSFSLNKLPLYARIGVPEVWRYDGERIAVLKLEDERYIEAVESFALPYLTSEVLTRFVQEGLELTRRVWMRKVREWARALN